MFIGQIMQRNQDHPQGANMRIGIGKVIILMQHIHILILGRQCQCRGCLPMLMLIHIHHGTGMIQGDILHLILDHLTNTMQLQEDQHLNNHASKTVSIIRNRSRAQGRRKRWSSKFTMLKEMVVRVKLHI